MAKNRLIFVQPAKQACSWSRVSATIPHPSIAFQLRFSGLTQRLEDFASSCLCVEPLHAPRYLTINKKPGDLTSRTILPSALTDTMPAQFGASEASETVAPVKLPPEVRT